MRLKLAILAVMSIRSLVPADIWLSLAVRAGAVDSAVRESSRSFTGWVVEPVFESPQSAADFAQRASGVVGVGIVVRRWVPMFPLLDYCKPTKPLYSLDSRNS
jgi:hypothetical protein